MKHPILYVDDEEINLYIFETLLKLKFEIYKADSADKAFEVLKHHPEIKLVVTDRSMPVMDGLTFVKKASDLYEDKTYIMLSAFVRTQEIEEAINEGLLEEYFSKPLDCDLFLNKTKELGLSN